MNLYYLIILLIIKTNAIEQIKVEKIEFEAKIDRFLINNLNKNLYIATSREILILDKNLLVLQTSSNDTNCSIDTVNNRHSYIFDINYYSHQQPTLLECSSNNNSGRINCRIRNSNSLKCIYENLNDDLKEFHIRKALSFSSSSSLSPSLINKNNFLYLMPTIKGNLGGDVDDLKLLYIFNLNSTQLFQSVIILNNAFDMDSEFVISNKQSLNVVYRFSFKAYVYYLYVLNDNRNDDKITKLLRFCDNNNNNGNLRSSELQLKCNLNSVDYLEALDAFFISNKLFILFKSASNTILCTIDLNKINSFYMNYIHICLQSPPSPRPIITDVDMCKTDFQSSSFFSCDCESVQQSSNRIMIDDETFCSSKFDGFINIKKCLYLTIVSNLRFDDDIESAIRIYASNVNILQVLFLITSKSNLYLHKLITLSNGNQMLSRFLKIDLKQYFIMQSNRFYHYKKYF